MTSPTTIGSRPATGLDLTNGPVEVSGVASLLKGATESNAQPSTFIVIRLATTDHRGVEEAMRASSHHASDARICLAIDEVTLGRLDFLVPDTSVGLILDDVSPGTPLSAIASHLIEAVRFRNDFVASASRSLRQTSVLKAMMNLAHDLGLATVVSSSGTEAANDRPQAFDCITTSPVLSPTAQAGNRREAA